MPSQHINLFQTKATLQPIFGTIEQYIRIASMTLISIVFSGGILVMIAYLVFGQQRDTMEREKQQLLVQVKNEAAKETLFVMIRDRLGAIDKIISSQVSYAPFITTTMNVIQSYPLSSFSMGEKNSIVIGVKVTDLEEATHVLTTLMDMEKRKEIANPVLQSFSLDEKGIQVELLYTVVL